MDDSNIEHGGRMTAEVRSEICSADKDLELVLENGRPQNVSKAEESKRPLDMCKDTGSGDPDSKKMKLAAIKENSEMSSINQDVECDVISVTGTCKKIKTSTFSIANQEILPKNGLLENQKQSELIEIENFIPKLNTELTSSDKSNAIPDATVEGNHLNIAQLEMIELKNNCSDMKSFTANTEMIAKKKIDNEDNAELMVDVKHEMETKVNIVHSIEAEAGFANSNDATSTSHLTSNVKDKKQERLEENAVMSSDNRKTNVTKDEDKSREQSLPDELLMVQKIQEEVGKFIEENGKKDHPGLLDNQVQCVNLHCQSGYDLAEAPVYVQTYFGVARRKNVLQKACRACFDAAHKHQEVLVSMLKRRVPLIKAEFPKPKNDIDIVIMDSVDEIYEEEVLPRSVVAQVEEHLMPAIAETVKKYNINYQIEEAEIFLKRKYDDLEAYNSTINNDLKILEQELDKTNEMIYKAFIPKRKELAPLSIVAFEPDASLSIFNRRNVALKSTTTAPYSGRSTACIQTNADVVAVQEVRIPPSELPPVGALSYTPLEQGEPVYIMKISFFGIWLKGKVMEICPRNSEGALTYRVRFDYYRGGYNKLVTAKQIAYSKPSAVRYPVGTRVIAVFRCIDNPIRETFYVGIVAEPPKHINKFRYLIFFDDGYAQYVKHEKIHLVCESSGSVHEDVHPDSREFIKDYLSQYPERPMVKVQQGQILKTECNGKWSTAQAVEIDGSLVKMHFLSDDIKEWIYRGSTRLRPLYDELHAAAVRKEQGALSRHRSLGVASLKKRNMPYVEYSVDQDESKPSTQPTVVSKNVAKKSTAKPSNTENSSEKYPGPPRPFERMEYVSKGYTRVMNLPGRLQGRIFTPHQCGSPCIEWTKYSDADCKGIPPLAVPLFFGFERQVVRSKGKKLVMYRGPCGRRLRNMIELHRYLRLTNSSMGVDLFDFDYWIHVLDEFYLEPNTYCTYLKDLSYDRENTPVSCLNEIDHSWPLFMDYTTSRIPQNGVRICLDEEFLVCCNCTDDCQDKEKCECWQLTIEGTKLGNGGQIDSTVGYQHKRLPEPVTTGIYECNSRCKCSSTCLNRVAQHPLQLNLQVFRTLKKGWGLRTLNDVPKGCFICIYAGRLHTEQSANDDGRVYGDEYLAELDYIEVVERFKEGYESDVVDSEEEKQSKVLVASRKEPEEDDLDDDEPDDHQNKKNDRDYVPLGVSKTRLSKIESSVSTRARNKISSAENSDSEKEKEKKNGRSHLEDVSSQIEDDDDEMQKKPSKFTPAVSADEENHQKFTSVREMFGDGADDCYIMDAKSSGNIGRYLNHSCQPNVFVQNVFVDTHDVRFPWVAFFALTSIRAGTELTWDYNYDVGSVHGKVLYCYCNSAECRGRLL